MTPAEISDGTAREIPAGRLASFEDEPMTPALSLPPRRGRRTAPAERPFGGDSRSADAAEQATRPQPAAADVTGQGAIKASNVHIPVTLVDALNETKRRTRMSNGDIITALEHTHDRLKTTMRPQPTTGGSLFTQRVSRPSRTRITQPVTPLNYRLTSEDYAVLDRLVAELGATSRSHLISVALTAYYQHESPT